MMDYTRERRDSGREYSGTGNDYTLRGSGILGAISREPIRHPVHLNRPTILRGEKMFKSFGVIALCCSFLPAQTAGPERKVQSNLVTSERDPRVQIRLPESARYVGADRFVLYDMADCELHVFVDGDEHKSVQRLYWVQFEGYLPTRPEFQHTYDSPRHTNLAGLDFFVDTWVRAKDEPTRPGSDLEHIVKIVSGQGYHLPDGMMYVRLVYLFQEKRKELMIIYAEDSALTGHSATELQAGGKAHAEWPILEKGLLERAEKSVKIAPIR